MTEAPSSVPFIHTIFLCLSPSATDHAPPLNVTNHPISHMLPPTCPHRCVHICHQSTMRAPHSREGKGTHVNALQASNHNHGHTHCKGLCVLERLMATGDWTLTHRQRWGHVTHHRRPSAPLHSQLQSAGSSPHHELTLYLPDFTNYSQAVLTKV